MSEAEAYFKRYGMLIFTVPFYFDRWQIMQPPPTIKGGKNDFTVVR